ncbi:MAG TPA: hypothetical protein VHT91_25800 [Kofleriaceae bacterium]|jgi:hypothetical protein|nr:hypothetical protein [Kofleriaceae bacterium]
METSARKLNLKSMLFAGAALLSLAAVPLTASARSQAANAAGFRPTCLGESFGAVVNNCGVAQTFAYSAPIDTTNTTYHVTVRAQGASASSNVTCWGHGVSEDGTTFWLSNTQSLPFFGPSADLAALNVFVPTNGVMNIYCTEQPGGSVWGYHF